jgi:hypothetical protein
MASPPSPIDVRPNVLATHLLARQSSCEPLLLTLEFSGGAELLVGNKKEHHVKLAQLV